MTFTKEEALAAMRALYRTAPYHNERVAHAGVYIKQTGIVPDWLTDMTKKMDRWFVLHGGKVFSTTAKSRENAVNYIRYRLYGETPASECGDFDAVNPAFVIMDAVGAMRREEGRNAPRDLFGRRITQDDVRARIRRMAS